MAIQQSKNMEVVCVNPAKLKQEEKVPATRTPTPAETAEQLAQAWRIKNHIK